MLVDTIIPADASDVNQEGKTLPEDSERTDFAHWILVDIPADDPIFHVAYDLDEHLHRTMSGHGAEVSAK